jgi:hypothetical protein
MSFWDDDEIRDAAEGGGKFIKMETIGDTCSGTIKSLDKEKDPWDRLAIKVEFEDGRVASFAQVVMVRDLFLFQPMPGETLTVTLAHIQKNGAKTLKLFRGEITRLDGSVEKFDQTT